MSQFHITGTKIEKVGAAHRAAPTFYILIAIAQKTMQDFDY
ncbi:MAG: hypothetical protein ACK56L_21310 [Pseudanabaena sp.]